jgi:peptidoglycan LD-endopeptidase CwlK
MTGIIKNEKRMDGLHPDLVRVMRRAAKSASFTVTEGLRTIELQREYVRDGKSQTLNSRHIKARNGYGHAIDIYPVVNGKTVMDWEGGHFDALAKVVKSAAKAEGVPIEWGGDWKRFRDGPHWQLPWAPYDGKGAVEEIAKFPRYVPGGVEGVNGKPLATSRTMAGGAAAGLGGAVVVAQEARTALTDAKPNIEDGGMIGLALGAVILIGAAIALYARWDDAGRPRPAWWPA